MNNYIPDGHTPIRVPDLLTWAAWFETADRTVKKTSISDGADVSTVFLGLDHQFGDGPPLLFETLIFGGDRDGDMWRYSTWEEAEAGHDAVVDELTGQEKKVEKFEDLLGKVLANIENIDDEELAFTLENGEQYKLYHSPDCCESVTIEDICGDLKDLIGSPILMAEEVTHDNENPEGVEVPEYQDSFTWTFYKLATIQGYVTIRWYGESNGYYSESVDFAPKE